MSGRNWYRDDPVRDAEDWAAREDTRPLLGHCEICGQEIYGEDDDYDADDAYVFEGDYVCDNCLFKYLDREGYKI